VGWNPVFQFEMTPESLQIVLGPVLDLDKGIGPHQDATNSHHQ
jgi:hypothetical protein